MSEGVLFNKFFVGVQQDDIVFVIPVPKRISKADALNLAAWLVALSDRDDEFPALLKEVQET